MAPGKPICPGNRRLAPRPAVALSETRAASTSNKPVASCSTHSEGGDAVLLPRLDHSISREVIFQMKTLSKVALIAVAIAFLLPLMTQHASAQPQHPAYLHALSDLRDARAHLERPDGGALHDEERNAVE